MRSHRFVIPLTTYRISSKYKVCVRACVRVCTGAGVSMSACSLTNTCTTPSHCHLRPLLLHHMFRHYLMNGTIFGKKGIEHKIYILIFSTPFILKHFSMYEELNEILSMRKCLHVKYPLFLSDFNEN